LGVLDLVGDDPCEHMEKLQVAKLKRRLGRVTCRAQRSIEPAIGEGDRYRGKCADIGGLGGWHRRRTLVAADVGHQVWQAPVQNSLTVGVLKRNG
jgi:hypothetical protein